MGKLLVIAGVALILLGFMVMGKLGPLGRLPGDILIERDNTTIYIPIVSMLIISLFLTLLVNLILRR